MPPRLIITGRVSYVEPDYNSFTIIAPQTVEHGSIRDSLTVHAEIIPTHRWPFPETRIPNVHRMVMVSGLLQTLQNTHATVFVETIASLNSDAKCIHPGFLPRDDYSARRQSARVASEESASAFFARLFQRENEFLRAG